MQASLVLDSDPVSDFIAHPPRKVEAPGHAAAALTTAREITRHRAMLNLLRSQIDRPEPRPDLTAIRIADTEEQCRLARELLERMYRRRGYSGSLEGKDDGAPRALVAADYARGTAIATLTLHPESQKGLYADRLYGAELDSLRTQGRQLCEMIRLAADPTIRKSRQLMGALFHIVFLHAYRLNCCTDLVIEVTPRHAAFYRRMLGFEIFGDVRWNPRVKTSGMLLRLDLDRAADRIRRSTELFGTRLARTLYPCVFPASQESIVFQRIVSREPLLALVA